MRWVDVQLNPPNKTLRQFAILWIVFVAGISLWQWYRHGLGAWFAWTAGGGLLIGLLGLIFPQVIRPLFVILSVITFPIGWMVSRIILAIIFYGVVTPIGLAMRLSGRDVLERSFRANQTSYWSNKPQPGAVRRYLQQF